MAVPFNYKCLITLDTTSDPIAVARVSTSAVRALSLAAIFLFSRLQRGDKLMYVFSVLKGFLAFRSNHCLFSIRLRTT